jgi:DNA-binding SARP family transcriptional activator
LLLLHANRVVSRDRLIDELWDGSPPETASTALQVHVSQLRKVLGHDTIVTQAPGYLIRVEPGALDLERFESLVREAHGKQAETAAERLREALALWRGPPFADLDDSLARPERAELEERRSSALEQRIDSDLELGRHGELVSELEALVREDPLRERRRAQLMLALYRSGRQADALDAYRSGRKLLADELGLEPGGELRQLEKAILEHDPALAPPAAPPRRSTTPEERRRRLLSRSRLAVVVGALLLAGALAGTIIALTGGSDTVVVEANSVAVVNPQTGRVEADVPSGGPPIALAVGAGGVWVANADKQTLVHIDPESKKVVATIGLGIPLTDVAFGFGSVWVAGGNAETLIRIDPKLNAVEAEVDLGRKGGLVPQPVFLVATGAGSVWVTRGNKLLRIDPETNEARPWLGVDRPQGLAAGAGAVWVTQQNEHVLRIDAATPKVTADEDLSELPQFPVLYGGSLWLVGYGDKPHVWRLDSTTLTPQTAIPFRINGYPFELTGGTRALWTVGPDSGVLWRIDPATELATPVVRVGHHPISVAEAEGAVWVGTQKERLR